MACCNYSSYTLQGCNLIFNSPEGYTTDIDLTTASVRKVAAGKWIVESIRSGTTAIHDDDELASTGSEDDLTYELVRSYIESCKATGSGSSAGSITSATPGALSNELTFAFASGGTTSDTQDFGLYRAGSFYGPDEFNGDTISVYFDGSYTDPQLLFTFTFTDNHYEPTDEEMLSLYTKGNLYLTTSVATSAAADITMLVKS